MDDVDQRVRYIANRLLDCTWSPKEQLEYSEERGIPISTIRGWTAQAARVLRFLRGPDDEFRERLLANLDNAGRIALSLRRTWIGKDGEPFETEAPDVKAYIAAQSEQARILRIGEHKPEDAGDEPVPVEQLAAALRALGHEVKLNEPSNTARPEPASARPADHDTERPERERVEGFLEGEDEE